jgi:hypothetical protein
MVRSSIPDSYVWRKLHINIVVNKKITRNTHITFAFLLGKIHIDHTTLLNKKAKARVLQVVLLMT